MCSKLVSKPRSSNVSRKLASLRRAIAGGPPCDVPRPRVAVDATIRRASSVAAGDSVGGAAAAGGSGVWLPRPSCPVLLVPRSLVGSDPVLLVFFLFPSSSAGVPRPGRGSPSRRRLATMNSKFFATGDSSSDSDDRSGALTFTVRRGWGGWRAGRGDWPLRLGDWGRWRCALLGGIALHGVCAVGHQAGMLTVCWPCIFFVRTVCVLCRRPLLSSLFSLYVLHVPWCGPF